MPCPRVAGAGLSSGSGWARYLFFVQLRYLCDVGEHLHEAQPSSSSTPPRPPRPPAPRQASGALQYALRYAGVGYHMRGWGCRPRHLGQALHAPHDSRPPEPCLVPAQGPGGHASWTLQMEICSVSTPRRFARSAASTSPASCRHSTARFGSGYERQVQCYMNGRSSAT